MASMHAHEVAPATRETAHLVPPPSDAHQASPDLPHISPASMHAHEVLAPQPDRPQLSDYDAMMAADDGRRAALSATFRACLAIQHSDPAAARKGLNVGENDWLGDGGADEVDRLSEYMRNNAVGTYIDKIEPGIPYLRQDGRLLLTHGPEPPAKRPKAIYVCASGSESEASDSDCPDDREIVFACEDEEYLALASAPPATQEAAMIQMEHAARLLGFEFLCLILTASPTDVPGVVRLNYHGDLFSADYERFVFDADLDLFHPLYIVR